MKKHIVVFVLSLAAVLAWSVAAVAQDPTIELTGVVSPGFNYGGVYTGIYTGTLNGVSENFMCDDYLHEINFGDEWNSNVYGLSSVAAVGHGQYTESSIGPTYHLATYASSPYTYTLQDAYNAVAYLASLVFTNFHGTYSSYANDPYVNQISYAIWSIMDNPPAGPGNNNTSALNLTESDTAYWINQGLLHDGSLTPGIVFYSPDNNTIFANANNNNGDLGQTAQEFMGYNTPVPEPLGLALLGSFLTIAGVVLRKKLL